MKSVLFWVLLVCGLSVLSLMIFGRGFGGGPSQPVTANGDKGPVVVDEILPLKPSATPGKVELLETEFDFGEKEVGSEDQHVFQLKNVGPGVLDFKMGSPSCQCTVGEITGENGEAMSAGPLAPGESVKILVKWKMNSKTEKFRQTVPIYTTDPENRTLNLAVLGSVVAAVDADGFGMPTNATLPLLRLVPASPWNFGLISNTEPTIVEGYVGSKTLDEFTITEVPRENAHVKVTWQPAGDQQIKANQSRFGYVLKLEAGHEIPVGLFREEIVLNITYGKKEMPMYLSVQGRRSQSIELRGVKGANFNPDTNQLFFGEFSASVGKKAKFLLVVKNLDDELVLKSVEPVGARPQVRLLDTGKPFGNSKMYQAEIEIPPGQSVKHQGTNAERVQLRFNHPEVPELELSIDYLAK